MEELDKRNFEKFVLTEFKHIDKITKIQKNKEKMKKYQIEMNHKKYEQWYSKKNHIDNDAEEQVWKFIIMMSMLDEENNEKSDKGSTSSCKKQRSKFNQDQCN